MVSKPAGKTFLNIKAHTLLTEGQRIRHKMNKWQAEAKRRRVLQKNNVDAAEEIRLQLYEHKRNVLRPEARSLNLARAFMQGLNWVDIEKTIKFEQFGLKGVPIDRAVAKVFDRMVDIVHKYGGYNQPKNVVGGAVLAWMIKHPSLNIELEDPRSYHVTEYIDYRLMITGWDLTANLETAQ